jgi:hypothetical protein
LFERGLQLQAQGHAEVDYDAISSAEHQEYLRITKRLEWGLLDLPPHCASVLDPAVDRPPPDYTRGKAMGQDWGLSQAWRRALMAEVERRKKLAKIREGGEISYFGP